MEGRKWAGGRTQRQIATTLRRVRKWFLWCGLCEYSGREGPEEPWAGCESHKSQCCSGLCEYVVEGEGGLVFDTLSEKKTDRA